MIKCCPNIQCKFFEKDVSIKKSGTFFRKCDSKIIQRFRCNNCSTNFCASTGRLDYKHKKRRETPMTQHLLASGVSMRRIAKILKIHRTTVKRKMDFLAKKAKLKQHSFLFSLRKSPITHLQIDDLITIEHTKLKPLSVSVAVDVKTRKFLGFQVSRIPAFGHLAEKSIKKYGRRKSELKDGLTTLFENIYQSIDQEVIIETDEHKLYPPVVKKYFPQAIHNQFKGAKGCVAGQGELKKLYYDPLFVINHNFAMLRANINRLVRRTWCTTKDPKMLEKHLFIYIDYHNNFLLK